MKIYLDNCCFNRPFDDQSQLRIRLESEAKLKIQEDIRAGIHELVWSYTLEYENSRNPFEERKKKRTPKELTALKEKKEKRTPYYWTFATPFIKKFKEKDILISDFRNSLC